MLNEMYERSAPDFLKLPEQGRGQFERPSFMPRVEDLELNQGQIDRASDVLIGLVKSHMHLEVARDFDIKFYTGGDVEIRYHESLPRNLFIHREGMFELGVIGTRSKPEDRRQIDASHIYFKDRVGEIRDSRNTLFAIDRMLPLGLTFTGHDEKLSFIDRLKQSVYFKPLDQKAAPSESTLS